MSETVNQSINQSINLLSTVHSETNKCKLRKNCTVTSCQCSNMLIYAAHNQNKLPICTNIQTIQKCRERMTDRHMLSETVTSPYLQDVKVRTLDIAPFRGSSPQKRSGMACVLKGSHSFTRIPTNSILNRPYLPLPSQLQLVLIYRPWRDERLSWPGWLVI